MPFFLTCTTRTFLPVPFWVTRVGYLPTSLPSSSRPCRDGRASSVHRKVLVWPPTTTSSPSTYTEKETDNGERKICLEGKQRAKAGWVLKSHHTCQGGGDHICSIFPESAKQQQWRWGARREGFLPRKKSTSLSSRPFSTQPCPYFSYSQRTFLKIRSRFEFDIRVLSIPPPLPPPTTTQPPSYKFRHMGLPVVVVGPVPPSAVKYGPSLSPPLFPSPRTELLKTFSPFFPPDKSCPAERRKGLFPPSIWSDVFLF